MTAVTARLTTLAANIENVRRSDALQQQIEQSEPDVVIVLQAYRARRFLRSIPGYRLRQYRGTEAKGIAVLVKDSVRIQARRKLEMRLGWQGPESKGGRWHSPRVYPALVLEKGGVLFRVLGIHLPTHNNPEAQQESLIAVQQWFGRHAAPSIAAGDWNRRAEELERTATASGATILSANTKVDHALVAQVLRHQHERVPTPTGAHGWSKYAVSATRET